MTRPPWRRRDLPWADVLLDACIPAEDPAVPARLPDRLPDPVPGRSAFVDGWTIAPHVLPGGPRGGSLSVLTLTAADGWTGAVVLTQFSGRTFAFRDAATVLPYLGRVLSPGTMTGLRAGRLRALAATGMPVLRAAMEDPTGWEPEDPDYAEPGHANRYLLRWASAGVAAADAAILERHQVRALDSNVAWGTGLVDWRDQWHTPHEVALWYEVGCRSPREAATLRDFGFDAETARDWLDTPLPPMEDPHETWAFLDAGWTPRAVREIGAQVNRLAGAQTETVLTFYTLVDRWAEAMHPRTASGYLSAGWSLTEARDAHTTGTGPDRDGLACLAALRGEPQDWRVPPSRRGVRRSPYCRARASTAG